MNLWLTRDFKHPGVVDIWKSPKDFVKHVDERGKAAFKSAKGKERYWEIPEGGYKGGLCQDLFGVTLAPGEGPVEVRVETRWAIITSDLFPMYSGGIQRTRKEAVETYCEALGLTSSGARKRCRKDAVKVRVIIAAKGAGG